MLRGTGGDAGRGRGPAVWWACCCRSAGARRPSGRPGRLGRSWEPATSSRRGRCPSRPSLPGGPCGPAGPAGPGGPAGPEGPTAPGKNLQVRRCSAQRPRRSAAADVPRPEQFAARRSRLTSALCINASTVRRPRRGIVRMACDLRCAPPVSPPSAPGLLGAERGGPGRRATTAPGLPTPRRADRRPQPAPTLLFLLQGRLREAHRGMSGSRSPSVRRGDLRLRRPGCGGARSVVGGDIGGDASTVGGGVVAS